MDGIGASAGTGAWLRAFDQSAWTVTRSAAQAANEQPDESTIDSNALIDGMVGMQLDAAGIHASIQVVRTQDQMLGTLLDMHA